MCFIVFVEFETCRVFTWLQITANFDGTNRVMPDSKIKHKMPFIDPDLVELAPLKGYSSCFHLSVIFLPPEFQTGR